MPSAGDFARRAIPAGAARWIRLAVRRNQGLGQRTFCAIGVARADRDSRLRRLGCRRPDPKYVVVGTSVHARRTRYSRPPDERIRVGELLAGGESGSSAGANAAMDRKPVHAVSLRRHFRPAFVAAAFDLLPCRSRLALEAVERSQSCRGRVSRGGATHAAGAKQALALVMSEGFADHGVGDYTSRFK